MMRMIAQIAHDTSRDVCLYKEDRRADEYRMLTEKMDMEAVFMENYKVHVFSKLPRLNRDWSFQVDNLHELWNTAADMINRAEFWLSFTSKKLLEINPDVLKELPKCCTKQKKKLIHGRLLETKLSPQ